MNMDMRALWDRLRRWGPPFGVPFLVVFGFLWWIFNPKESTDRIAFANLAVLTASGIVLGWYTWETRQLRRATLRQTDLQIRPFLSLVFDRAGPNFSPAGRAEVGRDRRLRFCPPRATGRRGAGVFDGRAILPA